MPHSMCIPHYGNLPHYGYRSITYFLKPQHKTQFEIQLCLRKSNLSILYTFLIVSLIGQYQLGRLVSPFGKNTETQFLRLVSLLGKNQLGRLVSQGYGDSIGKGPIADHI